MAEVTEFPGNSFKDRENEPQPDQTSLTPARKLRKPITVVGGAKKKQKGITESFAAVFFGDTAKAIGNYLLWDVLIPAAKDTIWEMIKNAGQMAIYGQSRPERDNFRRERDRTIVSYNSMYDRGRRDRSERHERPTRTSSRYDFSQIVFDRRQDAEDVLAVLDDAIDTYDVVSVAELFEACELEATSADRKYGWDRLTGTEIRRTRDGYILDLPQPMVLE